MRCFRIFFSISLRFFIKGSLASHDGENPAKPAPKIVSNKDEKPARPMVIFLIYNLFNMLILTGHNENSVMLKITC